MRSLRVFVHPDKIPRDVPQDQRLLLDLLREVIDAAAAQQQRK